MRTEARILLWAAVLVGVVLVLSMATARARADAVLAQRIAHDDSIVDAAIARHHHANVVLAEKRQELAAAHAATDTAKRRAKATHDLVQIAGPNTVRVAVTPGGPTQLDTVPAAVIDRIIADSLFGLAEGREITAGAAVDTAHTAVSSADSLALTTLRRENAALVKAKRPRFGFKAGAFVGATLTLLAALALRHLVVPP